jgi:flagellar basal-body rod modification protein FlgD
MSQITSTPPVTSAASSSVAAATASLTGRNDLANEGTFLKLLVAQLQNQDPLQPQDGTQFVTQLAQFSGLEQNLAMRSDLDAIKTRIVGSTSTNSNGGAPSAA